MADELAKLRAELNIGAIDTPNFIKAIQAAYQNMPGAGVAQAGLAAGSDLLGGLAGNLYGVGKQALSGQLGNPQAGNQAYADAQQVAQALHYNPPTQAGQDIYNAYNKVGEATGPLPELWNTRMRFTPDDLRVAGRTVTQDIRNFPSDYTNAQAGITRDYSTLGSRVADVAETTKPFIEPIYNQVMETGGFNVPGMPNQFSVPVASYAVKPKGGNWPTNLGSTAPLSEQGALGEHLSKVQYDDPLAVFESQLKKHHPRATDNRELIHEWEDFLHEYLKPYKEFNAPKITPEEFNKLPKQAADEFVTNFNSKLAEGQNPLYTASEIEQALPAYNAWVMGPYQKYITNQMGTGLATDPLLQAVNESSMPPHEIFGQDLPRDWETESIVKRAAQRREDFPDRLFGYTNTPEKIASLENSPIGKITATTPEGLDYENALDASLYAKAPYSFPEKEGYPVSAKLDRNTLISDLLTQPEERTGFSEIRKKVFQDLLSGNLDLAKMSNVTPATITRQMIKDKIAEFKEQQLSKQGAADWIPKRAAQMPTDMAFADGSKMTIITPEMANADESMTARDLGQITIDLNQCVGAGCHGTQDYPGHGPFLVPHTGKPPRGKIDYDHYGYLRRLKNGEIEIASLKDPEGVSQATLELKIDKPKRITSSQKESAVGFWLEDNKTPEDVREFYNNKLEHGIDLATYWAVEKFPELQARLDNYNGQPKKSVQQLKGKDNGEVDEAYVPQMVEWLNKNAPSLTDVRELKHLKEIHDLDNHYDSIGGMTRERSHWYSPTVEEFFKKADDERLLPRFFTTDQFAQLATDRGVDLSAEPPRKLSDWDKQTLREEVYSVLIKDPNSLYLQDNLKDHVVENLDLLFGDMKTEEQLPLDVHRKLADMLLDHNGKYRDQLISALGQLSDKGPNGWVDDFTQPQISNMLNIMAGWFERHPMEKLPSNADFEKAITKHPDPFNEITIPESPWHPSENDLVNAVREMEPENVGEFDQVNAIRQRAYETASESVRGLYTDTFLRRLYEGDMDARQSIVTDMEGFPGNYGLTNYSPAARNAVIERVMQEGIFWPHENPQQ